MNQANWSELKRLVGNSLTGDSCLESARLLSLATEDRDSNLWFYSLVSSRLSALASYDAFAEADVADSLFTRTAVVLTLAIEQIETDNRLGLIDCANELCSLTSDLFLLGLP